MGSDRCPGRWAAPFALVLVVLAGCDPTSTSDGSDEASSYEQPPPSADSSVGQAPFAATCTPVTVPSELRALVDACRSASGQFVSVTNTSPLLLHVEAGTGTELTEPTAGDASASGAPLDLLAALSAGRASVELAPGASVTGTAASGAAPTLEVSLPVRNAAADYAGRTLTSWVQARAGGRAGALRGQVASCANEASTYWLQTQQEADAPLESMLADAALGPALQCRRLVQQVEQLQGPPPPRATLTQDLARHARSVVWDDVLQLVRGAAALR